MKIKTSDRVTICGMPGTGKTTFAKALARGMAEQHRLIIFDVLGQYGDVEGAEVVVPSSNEAGEFAEVCRDAWRSGNCTVVAEEAELYIGEKRRIEPDTWKLLLRGRNRGIGLVAVTRRVADLRKTMFSLSEHVFIFRHFSPNDCHYLGAFLGSEWTEKVRNLKPYWFLHYQGGEVRALPPISVR